MEKYAIIISCCNYITIVVLLLPQQYFCSMVLATVFSFISFNADTISFHDASGLIFSHRFNILLFMFATSRLFSSTSSSIAFERQS